MVYESTIRKKRFDEEGSEVLPAKNRPFKLNARMPTPKVPTAPQPKAPLGPRDPQSEVKIVDDFPVDTYSKMNAKNGFVRGETDETGLDKAYKNPSNLYLDKNGTLYASGTKGGFIGSEWVENYITMGVPLFANALGMQAPYAIEDNERYKELDNFMKLHPGQVKNLVGHSKGSAVIHTWMKNNPPKGVLGTEFSGQSRLYATPYEDVLGKESIKQGRDQFKEERKNPFINSVVDKGEKILGVDKVKPVKGETRTANNFDPAAILDRSAERYDHGDPWKYITNGGPHDYHEGVARFNSGFGLKSAIANKPGTDIEKTIKSH